MALLLPVSFRRLVRFGAIGIALACHSATASLSAAQPAGVERFALHTPGSRATVDHTAWDRLLKRYVETDPQNLTLVDYARFKSEARAELKSYLRFLEHVAVHRLDRPEQLAFWANLYNAKTIDIVLDHYPIASIRSVNLGGSLKALVGGGPWQAPLVTVGGVALSLDDVEHRIVRAHFKDPRAHYVLNCASVGCPNLISEPLSGARIDAQLDAAAHAFINSPRAVRVAGNRVAASSIYSWFQADFGGSEAAVLDHIRRYADEALKRKLDGITGIAEYGYDWSLNDLAAIKPAPRASKSP